MINLDPHDEENRHHWENFLVAVTAQASAGLIPPEVRSLYVQAVGEKLILHVAVAESTPRLEASIRAILEELDILLPSNIGVDVRQYEGSDDWTWDGRWHCAVYSSYRDGESS